MKVVIKNLSKTGLQEEPYLKLVKKYASKLKHDVIISFDFRLKEIYGNYCFDGEKRIHLIKISPIQCCFSKKETKLDSNSEKYNIVSTTIHEIYHAKQKEEKGSSFWKDKFSCAPGVRNPNVRSFYSECEVRAREFEEKNVLKAVQHYDSYCEE